MASGARPPHRAGAHARAFALLLPLWCPPVLLWGCASKSGQAEVGGTESAGAASVEVPCHVAAGTDNLTCQVPSDCKDLPESNVSEVREHITLLNVSCQSYANDCKAAAYAHEVIEAQERMLSDQIEKLESDIQHMDEEWSKTAMRLRELNMSISQFRENVDQMQVVSQQVRAAQSDPVGGNASTNASSTPDAGNKSSDPSATAPNETANNTSIATAAVPPGQTDVADSPAGATAAPVVTSLVAASEKADTSQDVVDDTALVDADASQADALSNTQRAATGVDALPAAPAADELLRSFQAEAGGLDG